MILLMCLAYLVCTDATRYYYQVTTTNPTCSNLQTASTLQAKVYNLAEGNRACGSGQYVPVACKRSNGYYYTAFCSAAPPSTYIDAPATKTNAYAVSITYFANNANTSNPYGCYAGYENQYVITQSGACVPDVSGATSTKVTANATALTTTVWKGKACSGQVESVTVSPLGCKSTLPPDFKGPILGNTFVNAIVIDNKDGSPKSAAPIIVFSNDSLTSSNAAALPSASSGATASTAFVTMAAVVAVAAMML
ncbi:hypothetical protein SeMB42_g07060 [Synchytrium endobioticum]|nr:hypothetical protein SeMB42_g07060 [Synchytrium endobioticum]